MSAKRGSAIQSEACRTLICAYSISQHRVKMKSPSIHFPTEAASLMNKSWVWWQSWSKNYILFYVSILCKLWSCFWLHDEDHKVCRELPTRGKYTSCTNLSFWRVGYRVYLMYLFIPFSVTFKAVIMATVSNSCQHRLFFNVWLDYFCICVSSILKITNKYTSFTRENMLHNL